MNLNIPQCDVDIEFSENIINVLTIEEPGTFSSVLYDLWNQTVGGEGTCNLYSQEKQIKFSNGVEIISNPFAVNCNDRKIITKIYQELEQIALERFQDQINDINSKNVSLIDDLVTKVSYPLSFNFEPNIIDLFKAYTIENSIESKDYIEYLLEYMKLKARICGVKLFICLNLKSFIPVNRLEDFYKSILYEKINLLIIEGNESYNYPNYEKHIVIDKDLCKIVY